MESPDTQVGVGWPQGEEPVIEGITAVIPCGGEATGIAPLNQVMPKTLLEVRGKPVLYHILDSMRACSVIKNVIIMVSNHARAVREAVQRGDYDRDDFVGILESPKEVAGILKENARLLGETFLLHYEDITIHNVDWYAAVQAHAKFVDRDNQAIGTLLCSHYYPLKIGLLKVHPKTSELLEMNEKPSQLQDYANVGVGLFRSEILDYISDDNDSIYGKVVGEARRAGKTFYVHRVERWDHVDSLKEYLDIQAEYYQLSSPPPWLSRG